MPSTVDALIPLVTRFPSLVGPLLDFSEVVCGSVDRSVSLVDAEQAIAAEADGLVREGLGEALLAHQPDAEIVEVEGRRYKRPHSRSSLERGGDCLGERWEQVLSEAEDLLPAGFEVPEEATTVSLSFGRVAVPMEEPVLDAPGGTVHVEASGLQEPPRCPSGAAVTDVPRPSPGPGAPRVFEHATFFELITRGGVPISLPHLLYVRSRP